MARPAFTLIRAALAASSLCTVLTACAIHADAPPSTSPLTHTIPDHDWDAAFTRTSSWNGGDIAHSIDLRDGRTLWLFGDSIFGPVVDNKRIGDASRMLRGGVAWHPTPRIDAGHFTPAPDSITFAAPEPFGDAPVVNWARPSPGLFPEGTWYWLMNDAVRLDEPFNRLVLLATAIGPSGNPDGMWNFRRVGGAVITIDNPEDPPDRWIATHAMNPRVTATPAHGEPPRASDNEAAAIVEWPALSRCYFVFGVHADVSGSQRLTVLRVVGSEVASPKEWENRPVMTLGSNRPAPSKPPKQLGPAVPDEFTIQPIRKGDRDMLVLIYSEPFRNHDIWARTAAEPEGEWSEPVSVYQTPDLGKDTFAYAAKGHAHLSRPGELLVSYAVNGDLGHVFNDASLYRPRFIRVPLSVLPDPPQAVKRR